MADVSLDAVSRSIKDTKKPKKKSNKQVLADKVRRQIPTSLGRSTSTLSNRQCIRIGRIYGIIGGGKSETIRQPARE